MPEDANGYVRITNADIYRGLEELRKEVGGRFDALAKDDRERWNSNAAELTKMKLSMVRWKIGIGVGFVTGVGMIIDLVRRFGLPFPGGSP